MQLSVERLVVDTSRLLAVVGVDAPLFFGQLVLGLGHSAGSLVFSGGHSAGLDYRVQSKPAPGSGKF